MIRAHSPKCIPTQVQKSRKCKLPACSHHNESTQHFILDCPKYAYERWPLIAGKSMKNREYGKLLGNSQNAKPIINFIMATGRFSQEYVGRIRIIGEEEIRHGETGHWCRHMHTMHTHTHHHHSTFHPHNSPDPEQVYSGHEERGGKCRKHVIPDWASSQDPDNSIAHLMPWQHACPTNFDAWREAMLLPHGGSGGDLGYWSRKRRLHVGSAVCIRSEVLHGATCLEMH